MGSFRKNEASSPNGAGRGMTVTQKVPVLQVFLVGGTAVTLVTVKCGVFLNGSFATLFGVGFIDQSSRP